MKPFKSAAFAFAALLIGGAQHVAAELVVEPLVGGVNLFLDYRVEVNAANACAAPDRNGPSFTKGSAFIYPSLLKKIQKAVGPGNINPAALGAVHQVQTKRFMESSARHVDSHVDSLGSTFKGLQKDDMVGFIFGNTNDDAYFETDDGELCVPAVKGTLLSFDGSIPHRTVMKSGHIELIGPFLLSSEVLGAVGDTPAPTSAPPTTAPTSAPTTTAPTSKSGKSSKAPKASKMPKSASVSTMANQQLANQQPKSIWLYAFGITVMAGLVFIVGLKSVQKWYQPRRSRRLGEVANLEAEDEPEQNYGDHDDDDEVLSQI